MEDLIIPDVMTNLTISMASKMREESDKAIKKFCKEQGYDVKTPDDLIKVQNELAKENKFIRCETFTKIEDNNVVSTVLTFIDNIEYPLSRKDICTISGLSSKGYSWFL